MRNWLPCKNISSNRFTIKLISRIFEKKRGRKILRSSHCAFHNSAKSCILLNSLNSKENSSNKLNASPSFIAEGYQIVRCWGRSKVMKCDMLHTCSWYSSALVRGLWKFLEDLWVVLSTSDQLLTGTNARSIPGVTAQMAAHRGFSAISRLYQYQLRPSKV